MTAGAHQPCASPLKAANLAAMISLRPPCSTCCGGLAVLMLLAASPAVRAAPLVKGSLSIAEDGQASWLGKPVAKLPLPPTPRSLAVTRLQLRGHLLVHAKVQGAQGRACELILEPQPAGPRILFVGATGPQGVDGEWSRHISLDGQRLLLYQRRQGVERCDGATVYLFPQVYDFAAGRFRAAMSKVQATRLPELRATRRRPAALPASAATARPLNTFRFVAASTQLGDGGQAAALAAPLEAGDGNPRSSWIEGRGSDGRGEFITAHAEASPYRIRALRLLPGDTGSAKAFARSNRLKSALLVFSARERYRLRIDRDPLQEKGPYDAPYWVLLPKPIDSRCLTVVLERVYRGRDAKKGGGRTAIAELQLLTEIDLKGGVARLLTDLSSDDRQRARAAVAMLAAQGGTVLPALRQALALAKGAQLEGIVDVLARIGAPGVAELLVVALRRHPQSAARGRIVRALQRRGPTAVAALEPLLSAAAADQRRIAIGLLGKLGGQRALTLLLSAAGRGSTAARREVVDALVALGPKLAGAKLLAAIETPTTRATSQPSSRATASQPTRPLASQRRADLVLALTRLLRRQKAAAVGQRLACVLTPQGKDFELTYRAIQAIGSLGGADRERWLLQASRGTDAILRWHALLQLQERSSSTITERLREALRDSDPRVRAAAAGALRSRSGATIANELARLLRHERWPVVARAAANALSGHCQQEGTPAALRRAIRWRSFGIDTQALTSLVACQPTGLFDELVALAMNRKQPPTLRRRAASLLRAKQVRGREHVLASLFLRLRREAITSESAEQVATELAGVLGRLGGKKARRPLLDALALDPSPSIRAAAASGLGHLCWPGSLQGLRRALADPAPRVRTAARDTILRCRQR